MASKHRTPVADSSNGGALPADARSTGIGSAATATGKSDHLPHAAGKSNETALPRAAGKNNETALPRAAGLWLLAALGMAVVPHIAQLPTWVMALFTLTVLWRLAVERGRAPLPRRWILVPLTLGVGLSVFVYAGTIFGREAGVVLLVAMSALKLLEARTVRDGAVLVSLGLLLLMANLLYSQSLPLAAYLLVALAVLLSAQLLVHLRTGALRIRVSLHIVARIMLQSLPIMLILFILFPRIPGPLWGLPKDAFSGRSGLSDRMEPGNISDLILSGEVAFRVRFNSAVPPPAQRYWRALVLWQFDGRAWRGADESASPHIAFQPQGELLHYAVTLEPHGARYLPALDLPVSFPTGAGITGTFQLKRSEAVNERFYYAISSAPTYSTPALDVPDILANLALPHAGNDRARALARAWRDQHNDETAIVNAALQHYREEPFYYTLRPPLLGDDSVDTFLFNTRRGFCEHYASSFVFLMRAAGIPARVVTGYQGGELNGDYYIVRQSDAHAWAEVWLAQRGWVRVDPTAAVAPQRVEQGLFAAADNPEDLPLLARRGASVLRDLALAWDRANNAWNTWVLAYGPERQQEFLSSLGFGRVQWQHMVIALVIALGLAMLVAILFMEWRRRRGEDAGARIYRGLCERLARRGSERAAHEGPIDYTQRVARERPQLATHILAIGELYAALRFSPNPLPDTLRQLRRMIKTLRI